MNEIPIQEQNMVSSLNPGEWIQKALCADSEIDPDIFFESGNSVAAKKICQRCSVKIDCYNYAYSKVDEEGDLYGIWGGTSLAERKNLKRVELSGF